ncbi:NupC/NupG family nucleoside CNT transporter [Arenicella xantha]|uniref:CNT family concentrative nucleoside transporter n=1 Tax=Arenicella xantha TaxID=644221 RepID=A0A395JNW9_9GAMM|nr:nucleoside transporter C-terminal domain-containing protein [Arenicella xantha]RBP53360.1 CNT family concentrative nucleoside transporter [Arenicella xantha]
MDYLPNLQSALGLVAFPLIALLFCRGQRRINVKLWLAAVCLQVVLALVFLKLPLFQALFGAMNQAVLALQAATTAGTSFVFGYLGGGDLPFDELRPGTSYILAFQAFPLIIVIGALTALLSHWRILPLIIEGLAKIFTRTLNIGGAVALSGAANIFIGMIEAPLFIRNSIKKLSNSELFMVMTLGMSTVAGTVLVLYATFLNEVISNAVGHILTASIMSVPAAVMISLTMVPQNGEPTSSDAEVAFDYSGPMDAITQGAVSAMQMMLGILALIITFIALVTLTNSMLGLFPDYAGAPLSLERVLGWIMAPLCWLMGIPWDEAPTAGTLMGVKTIFNEFLAFIQQSQLPADALSPRSDLVISYALCGFANFGSLGILIGGLSAMAPERRKEITQLGLLSIVSGTLATCMTASVIGVLTLS